MKRRPLKSILHVYGCGWTAICEENKAWHLPNGAAEWVELPELPPIDDTDATIAKIHNRLNEDQAPDRPIAWCRSDDYQKSSKELQSFSGWTEQHSGLDMPLYAAPQIAYQCLGRQDLPIRDWSNLATKVDRAEMVLLNNINNRSIDVGCVLMSLIGEIRDELGLPKPSEVAK